MMFRNATDIFAHLTKEHLPSSRSSDMKYPGTRPQPCCWTKSMPKRPGKARSLGILRDLYRYALLPYTFRNGSAGLQSEQAIRAASPSAEISTHWHQLRRTEGSTARMPPGCSQYGELSPRPCFESSMSMERKNHRRVQT